MSQPKQLSPEEIDAFKKDLLDKFRDKEYLRGIESAVTFVAVAINTTDTRIELGYLPKLTGAARAAAITMEYLYRDSNLDIQGYNEPVCCTPFYYEAFKEEFDRLQESNYRKQK